MSKIIPIDENFDIFSIKEGDVILRKIPENGFVNLGIICQIKTYGRSCLTADILWQEDKWRGQRFYIDHHFFYRFNKYVIISS